MNIFNPGVREAPVTDECARMLKWEQLGTKIFRLLSGQPSERHCKELFVEVQDAVNVDPELKDFLYQYFGYHVVALVERIRSQLEAAKKKSDGRVLQLYCEEWLAFIKTIEFLTRIHNTLIPPLLGNSFVNICVDLWNENIINAEDSAIISEMLQVLSRETFEDGADPMELERVYKIVESFSTMHHPLRTKVRRVFEESFSRHMMTNLGDKCMRDVESRTACIETIDKLGQWKRSIVKIAEELHLSDRVQQSLEVRMSEHWSKVIFKEAAREVSVLFKKFLRSGEADKLMPLEYFAEKDTLGLLWSSEYYAKHGVPHGLRRTNEIYTRMRAICGEEAESPPVRKFWIDQARAKIRSEIITFPRGSVSRIKQSEAYCDFYLKSWTTHCKYLFFHDTLLSSFGTRLDKFELFDMCFNDWAELVFDVEREKLNNHLVVLLREYFSDPGAVLSLKLLAVFNSIHMIRRGDYIKFQKYFGRRVMTPYANDIIQKLRGKLTLDNWESEIDAIRDRVEHAREKLHFFKVVIKEFKSRLMRFYFEFLSENIEGPLYERNVQAINRMCRLGDLGYTEEGENFFAKITSLCEVQGLNEIQSHLAKDDDSSQSLALALVKASSQFDSFVHSINKEAVRAAVSEGFRSAVFAKARSIGCEAHQLLVDYSFSPHLSVRNGHSPAELTCVRMEEVARAFQFVTNPGGLSRLYAHRFTARVLSEGPFLSHFEVRMFRLIRQFLEESTARQMEHQLFDLLLSEKRMSLLASTWDFGRSETLIKEPEADGGSTLRALNKLKGWKQMRESMSEPLLEEDCEPNDAPTFQGVEFNIRVLREKIWPISPPAVTFTPPPVLRRIMCSFEDLYKLEYSDRKLTWAHNSSTVEMQWNLNPRHRAPDVQCNTLVAAVMLTFENTDEQTFEAILEQTNLSVGYLRAVVAKLIELNILVSKESRSTGETLALNLDFESPKHGLRLDVIHEEDDEPETVAKIESEDDVRRREVILTKAAMVRLAKRASKITKKELVQNTIWYLASRTSPEPSVIIAALEDLVLKEFLEYDGETDTLIYLP